MKGERIFTKEKLQKRSEKREKRKEKSNEKWEKSKVFVRNLILKLQAKTLGWGFVVF